MNLAELAARRLVLYVFPKMGPPDEEDPPGWNEMPGVYGCTQQTCAFRDRYKEFRQLGYEIAGLSAQIAPEQAEAANRLQLDFPLLADPDRHLGSAISLPTFEVGSSEFYKRLTMVIHERQILEVFYPIFPPYKNAAHILRWIGDHIEKARSTRPGHP